MTTERRLEPAILEWLEAGPVEAPGRLHASINDAVAASRQQRRFALVGRDRPMRLLFVAAAVGIALIAIAVAAGSLIQEAPTPTVPPSIVAPEPTPAPTSPSVVPSASPSPSSAVDTLIARLPADVRASCAPSTLTDAARAAGVLRTTGTNIFPGASGGTTSNFALTVDQVDRPRAVVACPVTSGGPDRLWAVAFRAGEESFENIVVAWPGSFFTLPTGDCAALAPAYGRWPGEGLPDGRVACWIDEDGIAWVTWSDERGHVVYFAKRDDGDLDALRVWWAETAPTLLG